MFTGLVQAIATIEERTDHCLAISLRKTDREILKEIHVGDSVAVNGVCLTVVESFRSGFRADISPETYARTNLGDPQLQYVNVELSLKVGDRLGGHFVSGHVDSTGQVLAIVNQQRCWEFQFQTDRPTGKYLIYKGSVAVNGISLTVARCVDYPDRTEFAVAVIPHTYSHTNLQFLQVGDRVNIETDMLGKYVERFVNYPHGQTNRQGAKEPEITLEFLAHHGWLC